MKIVTQIHDVRRKLAPLRGKQKLALVATMGNLHAGHLQLVQKAKELADVVVVSIFVNPLQFAPHEDFDNYPRTLDEDVAKLAACQVDIVFAPTVTEMYGDRENHAQVLVPKISHVYCGQFRPHFFFGVTTVVTKLFNIIQPDVSIFGEKDLQQLCIIKKMVGDLSFPIEISSVATVREQDGLAMSSRNRYLNQAERQKASQIFKTLCSIRDQLLQNKQSPDDVLASAYANLSSHDFRVDYLHICEQRTLALAQAHDKDLVILVAAWLGKTRLIDNLIFSRT